MQCEQKMIFKISSTFYNFYLKRFFFHLWYRCLKLPATAVSNSPDTMFVVDADDADDDDDGDHDANDKLI